MKINKRVLELMKKPQPAQRSTEWFESRRTRITASSVASLLVRNELVCGSYVKTFGLEKTFVYDNKCCNPYSSKKKFTLEKCKSTFTGSVATYHGQKFELVAQNIYELQTNKKVIEFGLLEHDTIPWIAASPDGITEDGVMLEIKCPYRRTITGIPPLYYYQQVQIQLEVADLEVCDFLEVQLIEAEDMAKALEGQPEFYGVLIHEETVPDKPEERVYHYSPKELFNNPLALNKWLQDKKIEIIMNNDLNVIKDDGTLIQCKTENYKKVNLRSIYWKTGKVLTTRILRDKEWFDNVKPILEVEWKTVLDFKKNWVDTQIDPVSEDEECLF